jgi:hypothetical protein
MSVCYEAAILEITRRRVEGPKHTRVDRCSCPPDHPAHQKGLRSSETPTMVVT